MCDTIVCVPNRCAGDGMCDTICVHFVRLTKRTHVLLPIRENLTRRTHFVFLLCLFCSLVRVLWCATRTKNRAPKEHITARKKRKISPKEHKSAPKEHNPLRRRACMSVCLSVRYTSVPPTFLCLNIVRFLPKLVRILLGALPMDIFFRFSKF